MSKITIVGAGSVGATIAYTLVVTGIASEIALIDVKEDKALGEAMDIRQGTPFARRSRSTPATTPTPWGPTWWSSPAA